MTTRMQAKRNAFKVAREAKEEVAATRAVLAECQRTNLGWLRMLDDERQAAASILNTAKADLSDRMFECGQERNLKVQALAEVESLKARIVAAQQEYAALLERTKKEMDQLRSSADEMALNVGVLGGLYADQGKQLAHFQGLAKLGQAAMDSLRVIAGLGWKMPFDPATGKHIYLMAPDNWAELQKQLKGYREIEVKTAALERGQPQGKVAPA